MVYLPSEFGEKEVRKNEKNSLEGRYGHAKWLSCTLWTLYSLMQYQEQAN